MHKFFERIRKFFATLGPVEQAQVVASTAVVVAMVTIATLRWVQQSQPIEWFTFFSVLTTGIFGFIIVFFTLRYGRLLESQKQELLALNTIAKAVNRSVEINRLLSNALSEVVRVLEVDYGWVYHVESGKLVLKSFHGLGTEAASLIPANRDVEDGDLLWIRTPQIQQWRPEQYPASNEPDEWKEIKTWASVPLMIKDRLAGVMIVASRNASAFSAKQLDLMGAFANQIGVALENAALFDQLRRSEERYMDLFEHSPDMYHIINREGLIISCNQTEADRLGYRKDELVGWSMLKLYPEPHHDAARQLLTAIFERGMEFSGFEEQMIAKEGMLIDVSVNTSVIYDEGRKPMLIRVAARDITEKKKLEQQILHAQRIDSIGNLAGGVAHDFNNILTSILGSTAIMKRKMQKRNQWYHFADIIDTAAKRGAGLTRQLLTFARKSTVQVRPVVVSDILEETINLFERGVDKTIQVNRKFSEEVSIINGDDGQLQQAILNLLINARDAMPVGGTISVETINRTLEGRRTAENDSEQTGRFVMISISDTGIGIKRDVQERIFEPFFTTKDQGKGTGLGLPVVYGVVKSHNGFITVQSQPGLGSRFTLHFPLIPETEKINASRVRKKLLKGNEHLLVIDDDASVGDIIKGMASDLGYDITIARSGKEALKVLKKKKMIKLAILDMNMPEMGGRETFLKLKKQFPHLRVLVSTGYSDTTLEGTPMREAVDGIIQKPYQIEELSIAIREALDGTKISKK
ncbi:MAG: ATP-binding protein [bacterium]